MYRFKLSSVVDIGFCSLTLTNRASTFHFFIKNNEPLNNAIPILTKQRNYVSYASHEINEKVRQQDINSNLNNRKIQSCFFPDFGLLK